MIASDDVLGLQKNLTGTSLDDYDRFFDAHNAFELEQRSASSHKLPIGEEYETPRPYDNRESVENDIAGMILTDIFCNRECQKQ